MIESFSGSELEIDYSQVTSAWINQLARTVDLSWLEHVRGLFRRDVIDWRDKEQEIVIIVKAFPSSLTDWALQKAFISEVASPKLFSRQHLKRRLHYFTKILSSN